jgi:hypothetical protein
MNFTKCSNLILSGADFAFFSASSLAFSASSFAFNSS